MLSQLFLLCCFFPFVSPYPIASDIQPLAGIFAAIIVLRKIISDKKIGVEQFVILAVPLTLLGYNDPLSVYFGIDLGKFLSLTFGALIVLAFCYSKKFLTPRFFLGVVVTYFVFTILLLLFGEPMINIQNLIIRNTNSVDFTYRGVPTLSTEPGLFGGLLVFFLLVCDYLYEFKQMTYKSKLSIYAMVVFMLIMTKSGTGYLYLSMYFLIKFISGNARFFYKLFSVGLLSSGVLAVVLFGKELGFSSMGRGFDIMMRLSDPIALATGDSSVFTRVVDFYLGLVSIFHIPLGVGNTATLGEAEYLMSITPFVRDFYLTTGKSFGLNSSFTVLTISYGVIFWVYIVYLFFYFSKSNVNAKFFALLYLSVSYSAAFPAIWILLALQYRKESMKSKSCNEFNELKADN